MFADVTGANVSRKRIYRFKPMLALILSVAALAQTANHTPLASPSDSPPGSLQHGLLNRYCLTCHNDGLRTAGLSLEKMALEDVGRNAEAWEKVVSRIRAGTMPPPGLPRPDPTSRDGFRSWLESALDRAAAAKPNPGKVVVHRLNRLEYTNAIRDLLALEVDSRSLLAEDDVGKDGFDNVATVLSVSPVLLEQYLSAARRISQLAIGDPNMAPGFKVYSVPKLLVQDERASEDLPFGTRGGVAIHHYFPMDGEYVVKIRLRRQLYSYILGLGRPHWIEVRLDGRRVKLFRVGGDAPGKPAPAGYAGNIAGDPEWETYMHFADDALEVRFPAPAGPRVVGVSFIEQTLEPEGVIVPPPTGLLAVVDEKYGGYPSVETVSIGGPFQPKGPGDTPSRRTIFVCTPSTDSNERSCAAKILGTLARRAYRRPVNDDDIQTLLGFYEAGRKHGGFEAGIQGALVRILTDPEFLFRIEPPPTVASRGAVYRLSDIELASRLSFFLWSTIPDDQLLDLAARGKLRDATVLRQQMRRMLADVRSKALIDNFAAEWLKLPKLRSMVPLPQVFPDFDENLREGFDRETKLFVESQLRADCSVTELLSADYTFINERLARHYGVPNVYGTRFRKVTFNDQQRGGLLGQGSVLMVTSYANRTSPVLRGKWVLDTILGQPPPPPPPDTPLLQESEDSQTQSLRERIEQHRKKPACAGCHMRMDPLGFALENYDAIGKWRSTNDGAPIDTAGVFPDGTRFDGVEGLRKLLLSRREDFVDNFSEKLLAYALGRDVEFYDRPAIRKITREAAAAGYRWSSILEGIVTSMPFQMSVANSGDFQARRAAQ